jgi:probable O-glycosylation ligase (exosortase A-associated)
MSYPVLPRERISKVDTSRDKREFNVAPERDIFTLSVGTYVSHYQVKKGAVLFCIALLSVIIGVILLGLPARAAFVSTGIIIFAAVLSFYPFMGLFVQIWLYFNPFHIYGGPEFLRPIFLVTFLILAFFIMRYVTSKNMSIRFPLEGRIALLLLAFMTISSFFAAHSSSLSFSSNMALFKVIIFYLLMINLLDTRKKLNMFIWFLIFCCALAAFKTIRMHTFYGIVRVDNVGGVQGTSGGLSTTLVMVLPLVFYKIYSRNFYEKIVSLALVPVIILGTILAGSRGGTLGLAGVLVLLVWKFRRKGITWLILGLVLAAAVVAAPGEFWDRTMTILEYQDDGSAMNRIRHWKAGFRMFKDHPLTGIGQGNFEWVSPRYTQEYYQAWLGRGFAAHNIFIQLLAEGGIQALAAFLFLMGYTFRSLYRTRRICSSEPVGTGLRGLSQAVEIGLIGFLICGVFISREGTDILYWLLAMGPVGLYLAGGERDERAAFASPEAKSRTR